MMLKIIIQVSLLFVLAMGIQPYARRSTFMLSRKSPEMDGDSNEILPVGDAQGGLQVMINSHARRTLINDLHYLPDEVDNMEPQVAVGVIKRMLPRPVNGMPKEWRKTAASPEVVGPGDIVAAKVVQLTRSAVGKVRGELRALEYYSDKYLMPVVPALTLVGIAVYDRDNLAEFLANNAERAMTLTTNTCANIQQEFHSQRARWNGASGKAGLHPSSGDRGGGSSSGRRWWWLGGSGSGRRDGGEQVDFEAFMRVQHVSLWDRLAVNVRRVLGRR